MRTPKLKQLRLVGLVNVVDPFTSVDGYYTSGVSRLLFNTLIQLESLELSSLHRLNASASKALRAIFDGGGGSSSR